MRAALDGIEAGEPEVLADYSSVQLKAALSGDLRVLYPEAVAASQALPITRHDA